MATDSVDTIMYKVYWERWRFAIFMFLYTAARGKVRHTYLQDKCTWFCVDTKTLAGGTISHHYITLTGLLPLLSNINIMVNAFSFVHT